MDIRRGGRRYCPYCKKVVETRVLPTGYSQVEFGGILAKRRQIIHGTDAQGTGGCGHKWYTLEVPEDILIGPR